jgi:hypothetical protein
MKLHGYTPRGAARSAPPPTSPVPLRGSPLRPMRASPGRMRRRVLVIVLALAVLGHAHWFFGNLYEAVVLIPQFAASPQQRLPISAGGILVPGSPALYYAPLVPLTVPAALAALAVGWRFGRAVRGRILGGAALSVSAALLGAYIITQLNFPLFYEPGTGVAQLEVMLRRWLG